MGTSRVKKANINIKSFRGDVECVDAQLVDKKQGTPPHPGQKKSSGAKDRSRKLGAQKQKEHNHRKKNRDREKQ